MAVNSTSGRRSCLVVLPSCKEGVSAQSFIQCFTLTHSAFTVQLATPGGKTPEFINQDDQSRRWLNDFRTKPFAVPLSLEIIDPNRYTSLVIPHAPGAAVDLANNKDLGHIILQFIRDKKLICAIGLGVAGLLSAQVEENSSWGLKTYSLTGSSVFELARLPDFAGLAVIPEDAVRDRGASFATSEPDCVHVVVDRHLVTGQNEASTLTAVQNLVLLCNQRQEKSSSK
ncbi:glutamine amidotransferase-like class 1 domain-containing protein 1 isoform X1 [Zootermopsis nevadensis]|uniref:glutamine amidotransferase-like class 1 domain-containing protein 1 isoform X1 n=1 Tax=Zootermopsis nevadensis TaxID=136037 RepID=UPI000B8E72FB|nr:glutamine amidotransferase-like class 1 domain-containing protein 1 isoform X1 [Zootermopsis nevadensis]